MLAASSLHVIIYIFHHNITWYCYYRISIRTKRAVYDRHPPAKPLPPSRSLLKGDEHLHYLPQCVMRDGHRSLYIWVICVIVKCRAHSALGSPNKNPMKHFISSTFFRYKNDQVNLVNLGLSTLSGIDPNHY